MQVILRRLQTSGVFRDCRVYLFPFLVCLDHIASLTATQLILLPNISLIWGRLNYFQNKAFVAEFNFKTQKARMGIRG